jgi:hypothetical protein
VHRLAATWTHGPALANPGGRPSEISASPPATPTTPERPTARASRMRPPPP